MQRITRNLILNKDFEYNSLNSDWAIDHDDASSWFEDHENVLVYGAHKWRDGIHKHYVHNLYVTPARRRTPTNPPPDSAPILQYLLERASCVRSAHIWC